MPQNKLTVKTIDDDALNKTAKTLNNLIFNDFIPDIIIGIRSGGYVVAEIMTQTADHKPLLLAISRRRSCTETKNKVKCLKKILKLLPYAVTNHFRIIEHKILIKKAATKTAAQQQEFTPDTAELSALRTFLQAHENSKILIVDDAIDSGATMKAVLDLVRKEANSACTIKTAAITVTTDTPLIQPDYILYNNVLCRFPWSFDFKN